MTHCRAARDQGESDAGYAFRQHFRCPEEYSRFAVAEGVPGDAGFFAFGSAVCYGQTAAGWLSHSPAEQLFDALPAAAADDGEVLLPFNPTNAVENLRSERYVRDAVSSRLLHDLYYGGVRALLPLPLRRRLQRAIFHRRQVSFPRWPVDCSVEKIFDALMRLALQSTDDEQIPFIWFWPEGRDSAVMLTHDVEEDLGVRHCGLLMDVDESFGFKSAFQLIPEGRYPRVEALVDRIRARGFETNLHDLNHDGRLYEDRERFTRRSRRINEYARRFAMDGFRAGSMHRNQSWFDCLQFQYEMSVPNVSHLEPQRGGCCSVMPYFIGNLLELPLTTIQDHALFHILGARSIELWQRQVHAIAAHHGLISFIVHPDYVHGETELRLYRALLQHLLDLSNQRPLWFALPGEINRWWRERSRMQLVRQGQEWVIRGTGRERARVAHAALVNGQLRFRIGNSSPPPCWEWKGAPGPFSAESHA